METATKKKRGRPSNFDRFDKGHDGAELKAVMQMVYEDAESDRTLVNGLYRQYGLYLFECIFDKDTIDATFSTPKGKWKNAGIAEQLGRMQRQNGYNDESCKQIARIAIGLIKAGWTTKQIEKWIRHGRNTNEW